MKPFAALVLAMIAAMLPSAIRAQQPSSKTYVLKAARMFDGKSNALATPGLVVVTGGKITAVGAGATIPADAEVIDLGDATLLPGFIDAHTHLTMQYREDYTKAMLQSLQLTIPEKAIDATVNARVTLMAGFTTVRDVGSEDYLDVGLRNAIDKGQLSPSLDTRGATTILHALFTGILYDSLMLPESMDLKNDAERLVDAGFDVLRFSPSLLLPGK